MSVSNNDGVIVVIEDEPAHADLVRRAIGRGGQGFAVECHASALSGLERVRRGGVRLILLDQSLPKMNGLEVLRTLRREGNNAPVIILTGKGDKALAVQAMRDGASDYLVKSPENYESLPHRVERVLAEWDAHRDAMRAQDALRESEERLQSIYDAANDAIFVVDPTRNRIVETNARACEMLGYTRAEFVDMPVSKVHPDEMDTLAQLWEQVRSSGAGWTDELNCTTKTGERIPTEISASVVRIKGRRYMLVMVRDITEREQAEKERTRLAAVVEQAAESIFITDTQGTIEYVNAAFERITGYSRAEAIGRHARMLKSGKHDEAFYRNLWRTITRGEVWNGRFLNKRKDGTLFEEKRTIFPIRDASGEIMSYVAVGPDITQEIALEGQLRHAHKMEAVGTLAAGLAHDFNNLLSVIRGHAEMAKSRTVDEELLQSLSAMEEAVEQAAGVTRSLLTFSQNVPAQKTPIDLCAAVEKATRMLRRTFPASIELLVDTGCEPPPWVNADPTQLQQIVLNLAINARDAMPRGGVLRISVSFAAADSATSPPLSDGTGKRFA